MNEYLKVILDQQTFEDPFRHIAEIYICLSEIKDKVCHKEGIDAIIEALSLYKQSLEDTKA